MKPKLTLSTRTALGALLLSGPVLSFAAEQATWGGGDGRWMLQENWEGEVLPLNGIPVGATYDVLIGGEPSTVTLDPFTVTLDSAAPINNLNIDGPGHKLVIVAEGQLEIEAGRPGAGLIHNEGEIRLVSGETVPVQRASWFIKDRPATLTGGGRVVLSDNPANLIAGAGSFGRVLINEDNTISGAGRLGDNRLGLVNRAAILADGTHPLIVTPDGSGMVNSGILLAQPGSVLRLGSGEFTNFEGEAGGVIGADRATLIIGHLAHVQGGLVELGGSSELQIVGGMVNGRLVNNSAGIIRATGNNSQFGGTVINPAGGQVIVEASATLTLMDGLVFENAGRIEFNGESSSAEVFVAAGEATLTGGGEILLSHPTRDIIRGSHDGRLVNEDNTIRGVGVVGQNEIALVNRGMILADGDGVLRINPGNGGVSNEGTMEAQAGGTLRLGSGDYINVSGTAEGAIRANGGMVVVGELAKVVGGIVEVVGDNEIALTQGSITLADLRNSGSGVIRAQSGTNTLGNLTNPAGGRIIVDNAARLGVPDGTTFQNDGRIHVDASAEILPDGTFTLAGSGDLMLTPDSRLRGLGAAALVNLDNVIFGSGLISSMSVDNRGGVLARSGERLTISPTSAGFNTSGRVQVDAGGTLRIGHFTQTAGHTTVDGTLEVLIGVADFKGGSLEGAGMIIGDVMHAGLFRPGASAGRLAIDGKLTLTGAALLEIEIAGSEAGTQHDRLDVQGALSLGGALRLHLIEGFVPVVDDTFTIVTATGGITGKFDQVIPPLDLPPGISLEADVQENTVVVTVVAADSYDAFAAVHFSAAEQSDPGISGPFADPNGNAIANIWEWILGNDPKHPGGDFPIEGGVESMDEDGFMTIKLPWRKGVSGVTLGVEARQELTTGVWETAAFDAIRAEDAGDHYILCLRILEPVTSLDRHFFRTTLRVYGEP